MASFDTSIRDVLTTRNRAIIDLLVAKENQIEAVGRSLLRPAALFGTADDVVKPGLSDDVLQRLALLRPPVEQGPAEIRWGKPSKFQITEPDQPTEINYTTIVNTTGGTTVDLPLGAKTVYFDEVGRNEEQIRIENPDDPEQYVIEARATAIAFQGRNDGTFYVFTFNYPSS